MKKENVAVKSLNYKGFSGPLPIVDMKKANAGNRFLEATEEDCVFTYVVEKV